MKNEYPVKFIDNIVNKYINKQVKQPSGTVPDEKTDNGNCGFFKLRFIGIVSKNTQVKLNSLVKRYCKDDISIKLCFATCKLTSMFSTKDKISNALKSFVVYTFVYANCNVSYVGETSRHLTTRMKDEGAFRQ